MRTYTSSPSSVSFVTGVPAAASTSAACSAVSAPVSDTACSGVRSMVPFTYADGYPRYLSMAMRRLA